MTNSIDRSLNERRSRKEDIVQERVRLNRDTGLPVPSRSARPVSELLSDAVGQLGTLIGNEFALARAELSERTTQLGRAAAMMAGGAVLLIPTLVMLLFALGAFLIERGFSAPAAYGLTGLGAAIVSAALIGIGWSRMSAETSKPSVTLDQIERDKAAAKEMVR